MVGFGLPVGKQVYEGLLASQPVLWVFPFKHFVAKQITAVAVALLTVPGICNKWLIDIALILDL